MAGFVRRTDLVDIKINRGAVDDQRVDARFFCCLTPSGQRQVGLAVGMAAGLEPAAQLAMFE